MAQTGIVGYQFDKMRVTPAQDSALYQQLGAVGAIAYVGYGDELAVTANGTTGITVGTGMAIICGRQVEVLSPISLSVPSANGDYTVVIKLDLSQSNVAKGDPLTADYSVENNQVSLAVISGSSYQHTPNSNLVTEDVFADGLVYMFPFAKVTRSARGLACINDTGYFYNLADKLLAGFRPYDSDASAWQLGIVKSYDYCMIIGNLNGTTVQAANSTFNVLKDNAYGEYIAPIHSVFLLIQMTNMRIAYLSAFNESGSLSINISRVRNGDTAAATNNNEWIACAGQGWSVAGRKTRWMEQ